MRFPVSPSVLLLAAILLAPNVRGDQPQQLPERVSPSQASWYARYKKQDNAPAPESMTLNTDPEPDLTQGFVNLFNGKDLTGWIPKGGTCEFEADGDLVVGTCVPKSESTYLSTTRDDFDDFVFTCDIKWIVEGNTGIMFRAKQRVNGDRIVVYGPQAEMEEPSKGRGWSGGIYGQSCGGYFYPLWLKEHEAVRDALRPGDWNRVTITAKGNVIKTWVNGIPAAHWEDDGTYASGFFGLQIHKGQQGTVQFKNVRVKEL
ncbi:MAG: DUF1080 domain-containing protein [Planctomycetota bacterium]